MIGEVEIGSSTELDPNFWKKTCQKCTLIENVRKHVPKYWRHLKGPMKSHVLEDN